MTLRLFVAIGTVNKLFDALTALNESKEKKNYEKLSKVAGKKEISKERNKLASSPCVYPSRDDTSWNGTIQQFQQNGPAALQPL